MKLTQPLIAGRNVCEACGTDVEVKRTGDQIMCGEAISPCPIRRIKTAIIQETADPVSVRGATHGDFGTSAVLIQLLRSSWRAAPMWDKMTRAQQTAFDEMALKQVRILYGDPKFKDHWTDISGYGQLGKRDCE